MPGALSIEGILILTQPLMITYLQWIKQTTMKQVQLARRLKDNCCCATTILLLNVLGGNILCSNIGMLAKHKWRHESL